MAFEVANAEVEGGELVQMRPLRAGVVEERPALQRHETALPVRAQHLRRRHHRRLPPRAVMSSPASRVFPSLSFSTAVFLPNTSQGRPRASRAVIRKSSLLQSGFFMNLGLAKGFWFCLGLATGFFMNLGLAKGLWFRLGLATGFFMNLGLAKGFWFCLGLATWFRIA